MFRCGYFLFFMTVLAACGGGGSSGNENNPTITPNEVPIASILNPGAAVTGSSVTLDGRGSKDPEGEKLSYAWTLVSKPADSLAVLSVSTSPTVSFTPDIDGDYIVRLTVTDPDGLSSIASLTVTSESISNHAPVIRTFTSSDVSVEAETSVNFSWKVIDPNLDSVSCSFDPLGNGDAIFISDCLSSQGATYTYDTPGTYRPRLTAKDARMAYAKADITETVTGNPTIIMREPLANAAVAQQFKITVTMQSTYEISSVSARIADRTIPLIYSSSAWCAKDVCKPGFTGTMDLSGLAIGEYTLEVIAQDIYNSQTRYYEAVIYDNAPTLTVSSPVDDSVALPSITVSASCTDDAWQECTIKVMNGSTELASGTGSVSRTVDLSAQNGTNVILTFVATDSLNQTTQMTRSIYVENSSNLDAMATVDGTILDAKDSRVLYKTPETQGESVYVLDRNSSSITRVPLPDGKQITRAFLSNYGAMLVTKDTGGTGLSSRVYDWNRNTLYDLGFPNSSNSLKVSGSYAIWSDGQTLIRRDLASLSNSTLTTSAGNTNNDVAGNGVVAWWSSSYQIYMYNGGTTQITSDALLNTYVLTDGHFIVYRGKLRGQA
jgi:hypothetical protein